MRTILITGASAGLGKATAKLFQSKGWKVIATMRTPEKETELAQLENVTLLPLDVTSEEQINATVQQALTVAEIAYMLGFEHPQSFNKIFKRKTNVSPIEFRESFN